jgi:hypothetical protein
MPRAIPRMAAAVAHTAGPSASLAGNPPWPWCWVTRLSSVVGTMAEARLALDAARGGGRWPPPAGRRPDRDLRTPGMESEP